MSVELFRYKKTPWKCYSLETSGTAIQLNFREKIFWNWSQMFFGLESRLLEQSLTEIKQTILEKIPRSLKFRQLYPRMKVSHFTLIRTWSWLEPNWNNVNVPRVQRRSWAVLRWQMKQFSDLFGLIASVIKSIKNRYTYCFYKSCNWFNLR